MSNNNIPSPDGVVQNSALSFLACAHTALPPGADPQNEAGVDSEQSERLLPAGLKALCDACSKVYPDQPNPLQVTTRLKYWLGGQDPLDYISMYWNNGRAAENIPPHWHYISLGMTDLHGDGRVHPPPDRVLLSSGADLPSGYGHEITLRLHAEPGTPPPLWPAALLHALARYVFTTGNKFCAGDHISWHSPLDGNSRSRVRHLLVADDPQIERTNSPYGSIAFLQLVGCTGKELRAAQRGSGFDVLKWISEDTECGGSWLVTRASRRRSCRSARSHAVSTRAAHLAGVSAQLSWEPWRPSAEEQESANSPELSPIVEQQIKETLRRGLSSMSTDRTGQEGHNMSTDSFEMSSIERALPDIPELMQGSWRDDDSIEYYEGIHLTFNAEGASLLPLAIDGRVRHRQHFTWRGRRGAVTALAPHVSSALPDLRRPYARAGRWLQIMIPEELAEDMSKKVAILSKLSETDSETDSDDESNEDKNLPKLPLTLSWPKYGLKITVVNEDIL